MSELTSSFSDRLHGVVSVPGDKSISHRALILASLAIGRSVLRGLLPSDDVLATASALQSLGVTMKQSGDLWEVQGVGIGGFQAPQQPLDLGNSGTGVRLLMGVVAGSSFSTVFTGDASLSKRPMARVLTPLTQMGVTSVARDGGKLPVTLTGRHDLLPITYTSPVASAQVKSAILLAGLHTRGKTTVIEPHATRDHTERMLHGAGAHVETALLDDGRYQASVTGFPTLNTLDSDIPGDPSSAAFLIVAALISKDASVTFTNLCMNPLRTGFLDTLHAMGANITIDNKREKHGEMIADITAQSSHLHGADIAAKNAASQIDEYPILSVAAAFAEGQTRFCGVGELRVKESDRLQAMIDGLNACGVKAFAEGDDLLVHGGFLAQRERVRIATHEDHRIAMSFLVLGLAASFDITVDHAEMINTSFPGFSQLMQQLGAKIV